MRSQLHCGRPPPSKFHRSEVRRYVQQRLRQYCSPDQIAGRSRWDFPRDRARQVSQHPATSRRGRSPQPLRKTLTLDNGKEFAEHQQLEVKALLKIYFAKPYCAWQRGANENTNRLIRQFFPKGTNLASIPKHRFTKVQQLLNNRPRKCLGYRTPLEVLGPRLLSCD